jgi:heme exporter protein A
MNVFAGHGVTCERGERTVFSALDFRVESGGALVLVGPNGSGKSSLLRLMAGLLRPAAGRFTWNGEDLHDDGAAHRRRLHFVGHADAVKPVLTVAEQLGFWAALRGGRTGGTEVTAALDWLGVGHLGAVPGRYLSAGQRRRLALARLLLAPAPLWLLDEPVTGLDAEARTRLDLAVARHRDGGGIVVLSSHTGEMPPEATLIDLAAAPPC